MKQIRKEWIELWWKMAGGVQTEYDKIKSIDVFEFWNLFDLWLDKLKEENARRRQQNQK